MKDRRNTIWGGVLAATSLFFVQCSSEGGPDLTKGSDDARLELLLTDAPIEEASAVYVNVVETSIRFQPAADEASPTPASEVESSPAPTATPAGEGEGDDGEDDDREDDEEGSWVVLSLEPATYDLLQLQDGVTALLAEGTPGPGLITQIRLVLDDLQPGTIVFGDAEHPLKVPSGSSSGYKIKGDVPLEAGYVTRVVIDFDAAKSIVETGNGKYKLKPVLSIQSVTLTEIPEESSPAPSPEPSPTPAP